MAFGIGLVISAVIGFLFWQAGIRLEIAHLLLIGEVFIAWGANFWLGTETSVIVFNLSLLSTIFAMLFVNVIVAPDVVSCLMIEKCIFMFLRKNIKIKALI